MRHALAIGLVSTLVIVAACGGGGSSAPTSPSPSMGSPGSQTTGATVTGTVSVGSTARAEGASGPLAVSGLTVTVVGTSLTATVGPNGEFTLTGVPGGNVQLRITGPGVDATLTLSGVQAGQTIQIQITVRGGTASIDADSRQGSELEVEGRIELAPAADLAPTTMIVAGRTINIMSTTVVRKGGTSYPVTAGLVALLRVGVRVHVKGAPNAATTPPSVDAREVMIQNENADLPSQYEYEGVIAPLPGGLQGSASAFTITLVDGRVIRGDSNTRFEDGSFASLAPGVEIEARGVIINESPTVSYLRASRIEIEDGNDDGEDDDDADDDEVKGTFVSGSGACPALSFTLRDKRSRTWNVTTSASTQFDPSCVAGTTATAYFTGAGEVEVEGAMSGSSIAATKVEKKRR